MLTFTTIQIQVPGTPALTPALGRYEANGRPAVLLYELEPEDECDDGLWCDLTVNLPEQALPGDDWAFVPCDNLRYLRELERRGLADVGGAVRYGAFGQMAVMARLAPALIAEEG